MKRPSKSSSVVRRPSGGASGVNRPTTVDAARAAAYALGTLPDDQRATFEERLATSPALREEVDALRAVGDEIALAAPPVAPSPGVRERLLARIATEAAMAGDAGAGAQASPEARPRPPLPDLLFALAGDATWRPIAPSVEMRVLARGDGGASYVLRLAPGGSIPAHAHRHVEHTFVLSGSIVVENTLCHVGDYHRAAAGTRHAPPYSAEGCTILVMETLA